MDYTKLVEVPRTMQKHELREIAKKNDVPCVFVELFEKEYEGLYGKCEDEIDNFWRFSLGNDGKLCFRDENEYALYFGELYKESEKNNMNFSSDEICEMFDLFFEVDALSGCTW